MSKKRFIINTSNVETTKGHWNRRLVEIFDKGENGDLKNKVGEYQRNYPHYAKTTFFPFLQDGKWFALYSKDYTATRVMELPSCKDIAGEDPSPGGFCPVDYFVPFGKKYEDIIDIEKDKDGKEQDYSIIRSDINGKIGFVSGCVWMDDGSWKIEFLDLRKITEGILIRDARFGRHEIPRGWHGKEKIPRLEKMIDLSDYDKDEFYFELMTVKHFAFNSFWDLEKIAKENREKKLAENKKRREEIKEEMKKREKDAAN